MKTPRFTDLHKFPRPYRPACATDITIGWNAEKKRLAAEKRALRERTGLDLSEAFGGKKK